MRKILTSLLVIGIVGVGAFGASRAFFSDTETSSGNVLGAGSIDLSLGSQYSSYNNNGNGSFTLDNDNNGRALYNFSDLKPGDWGTVSFKLSVTSNDAYACAMSSVESTPENGIVDPESDTGDSTGGTNGGELQNYVQFALFHDEDGDGQWDAGEPVNYNQAGDGDGFTVQEVEDAGWIGAADNSGESWLWPNTFMTANTPYNAGFMYCFGGFDNVNTGAGTFDCTATAGDYNDAQTDRIVGAIEFMAVQARNNDDFVCSSLEQDDEEDLTTTQLEGWPSQIEQGFVLRWQAEGRYGDNNPTAGDWELGIGPNTHTTLNNTNHGWVNGSPEEFSVTYDSVTNSATFTVGSESVSYTPLVDGSIIYLIANAPSDGAVSLTNLTVVGNSVADVISNGPVTTLKIEGVDTSSNWSVAGDVEFDWNASTAGSEPAFQVQVSN